MKVVSGVYGIIINGGYYVGSSLDTKRRLTQHKSDLKCQRHDNPYLQSAYNKYQEFNTKLLEKMPGANVDELTIREDWWKKYLNARYNIQDCITNFCVKPVYQYSITGDFIQMFSSVISASESVGVRYEHIQHAAQENEKLTKTAGGFIWKYYLTDNIKHEEFRDTFTPI